MPQLRFLLKPLLEHPALRAARDALSAESGEVALCGLTRSGKGLVAAALAEQLQHPLVVLTSDNETAEALRQTTATFAAWLGSDAGATVSVLPAFDCSPYERRSPHPEILEQRAVTLWNLTCGRVRVLFVPLPAALGRFRKATYYRSLAVELKAGKEVNLQDLVDHFVSVGYERAEPVANVGQYSLRGGIVDVFSPEVGGPFRVEFFGDRIESLREFDPSTQRSRRTVPNALILPLAEIKRSQGFFESLGKKLSTRLSQPASPESDWWPELSGPFPGWEFYAPLAEPQPNSLLALLERPLLVWDEPVEREQQLRRTLEAWREAFDEVRDAAPPRPRPDQAFLSESEFLRSVEGVPALSLKELAVVGNHQEIDTVLAPTWSPDRDGEAQNRDHPRPRLELAVQTQPTPKFHGAVKSLIEDLAQRRERRETVVFMLPTSGKLDRLKEILSEYEVPFEVVAEGPSPSPGPAPQDRPAMGSAAPAGASDAQAAAFLARGEMEEGVTFPELRLVLLTDSDLFGSFAWGRPSRERSLASTFISDLSDLKVGDYVVHVDHGVGLYQGLRQLEVEGTRRDFMLLTYQDEARLYVPLERLDLVERYRSGGDGAKPTLDRLGGATWARTKKRVKRALRDIAEELLRLYAERKMHGGTAFSPDTPWQREFEDAFEFEETPDQLIALNDIRRDLESPQSMDRLLCGDVGYGKTELAMRSAFKAVQDGKQVALLAPTTVLAFQHFATFRQRMTPFPVRVEMLSRFRSTAEQKKIIADTEAGRVDIMIGTHRVLSKDVRFRDLGLLIVDEEQRFGVAAKERLKKLKANVDVLTMSATPIPRTLHMSLGGLRDLSVIETPPQGRLAIQTVVAPFSDALIQSALLQELSRQGQLYFVHNRVESIHSIAALVQRLVPTARLGVSHGQMRERELERVMLRFMQGKYDVLVSTALIENGLDIPRANTIIVNRADRFGLADLYQLRGRVGRSNRRAYAYFLIPAEESLTATAKHRLAALKEFSDLGAGFRLAALDLELRGAGNLLGTQQHGHLNAIGIDLYLKMLEQTAEELKGAPAKPEIRTTLNLGLDIKIPESYIADESQRLRMYKRVSSLATPAQRADLEAELEDRYGSIPPSVSNLCSYALLKSAAERLLVQSIERKGDEIWIRFHGEAPVKPEKLTAFVRRHRPASFRPDGVLRFRLEQGNGDLITQVQNGLRELQA